MDSTAEYIIPLPEIPVGPRNPYGTYSKGSGENPNPPEQRKQERRE